MFTIMLDKERHAKVTNKALKIYKEKTGKDILDFREGQNVSLEDVETLLWACLLKEDPELTLTQVQNEVELYQLREFITYFTEGKQAANPI